jgi:MoaD family protein
MNNIIVKFIATLKEITKIPEVEVKLENKSNLIDLLESLDKAGYKLKDQILDKEGKSENPTILIMINDREIATLNGIKTMLKNGDRVSFIPIVHGG